MSVVRMLDLLKDWWKFIQIHQYYTMALKLLVTLWLISEYTPNKYHSNCYFFGCIVCHKPDSPC